MALKYNKKPVHEGHDAVFEAFSKAIFEMKDLDCSEIGTIQKKNVCEGGVSSKPPTQRSTAMEITLAVLLSLVLMVSIISVSRGMLGRNKRTPIRLPEAPTDVSVV